MATTAMLTRTGRFAVLATVVSSAAWAQAAAPKADGPHTLNGIVVDSLGVPVPGATVYVVELRRQKGTRDNGAFRFDSVGRSTAVGDRLPVTSRSRTRPREVHSIPVIDPHP